jgi:hypothetical protein
MKRFQKALFALVAVVVLGWVGAETASAQVTFFVSASSARLVRQEGLAEATGVVAFSANSSGTIVAGSVLTLDYGSTINGVGDGLACSGTIGITVGAVPLTPAQVAATVAKTCFGNVASITFLVNAPVNPGDSLTLSGTRVNANALGAGANVAVSVGTQVPAAFQASNPITTVVFTALTVATVQAAPSTLVKLTASAGATILFCNIVAEAGPLTANLAQRVRLDITENFAAAFTSRTDETGLGVDGAGAQPAQVRFRFRVSALPLGVSVSLSVVGGAGNTSGTVTTSSPIVGATTAAFKSSVADNETDFDVQFETTNTAIVENLTVNLDFFVTDISDTAFPKVESTATLRLTFRGASDPPAAPIFSESGVSRQYNGSILRTLACATYLLFPWVAYTGDGAVDTGLAIANTTKDPPQIGTTPSQKGDVTLHFWRAAAGTNPAPLKIATALEGGQTTTYVLSQLGAPFQGYIIAVCAFQMGHGLAAFLSGGAFNGYIAMVITNPRIPFGVTEASGH